MLAKNFRIVALIVGLVLIVSAFASAQDVNYKLHAGLLYHFTKQIEWPVSKQSGDFVIGVLGNANLTEALEEMAKNRTVGNQKIVVLQMKTADDASKCNIVYVQKFQNGQFNAVHSKAKSAHVLLITESEDGGKRGAGINFITVDEKLKFELNKTALEESGLKVSNELVKLAIPIG
ncbi:MAG: YfiR family protein [Cytophagales bacterium]|nr:MAG: YfiR family protein [Cytophagales bacterium]